MNDAVRKLIEDGAVVLVKSGSDVILSCSNTGGNYAEACAVHEWLVGEIACEMETVCICHERDSSHVCDHCFSLGYRGHMQRGL